MKRKFVVQTVCDFGTPGRRSVLTQHRSLATAGRQYMRWWKIYGRGRSEGWKVWLEEIPRSSSS